MPYDHEAIQQALAGLRKPSTDLKRLLSRDFASYDELAAEMVGALPSWEDTLVAIRLLRDALGEPWPARTLDASSFGREGVFHHGDLVIQGNLELLGALVVTGSLRVDGVVDDNEHASKLVVGGDCSMSALRTSGEVQILGELTVDELIYAMFNDHVLAAERITTPVLLSDDHGIEGRERTKLSFDFRFDHDRAIKALRKVLLPELIVPSDDEGEPDVVDHRELFARLARGEPIWKKRPVLPKR